MELKQVCLQRNLSDESCSSILSDDLCAHYQTEIYEQLPSSLRQRQRGSSSGAVYPVEEPSVWHRNWDPAVPPKALPLSMQEKRNIRDKQQMQKPNFVYWQSWKQSHRMTRTRVRKHISAAFARMSLWRHTFHEIEGRFGMGVKAYFIFLRYLLCLNLLHCLILSGTVQIPTLLYGRRQQADTRDYLRLRANDSFMDFFLGSGFLERSPVFYGFYTRGSLALACLNTPLLFLLGITSTILLSLIMLVCRVGVMFKHTWLTGNRLSLNACQKVFCGWNFCIREPQAASVKHGVISNEFKMETEEQLFHQRVSQRTPRQWLVLVVLRVVLNLIVVILLGGSFYMIYFATKLSQSKTTNYHWMLNLLFGYLPPITITLNNLFLLHVFCKISAFEDYSLSMQLNLTLIRSIVLKLASLVIYLYFLYNARTVELNQTSVHCWENELGKKMFRLCIFDLLACFCNTAFVSYPRKWLVERYPQATLARIFGEQQFVIPMNVLDLVYSQTVIWVGVFYCPLLPTINMLKLFVIFYVKKFTVLRCCVPEPRMFRASSSSVLFHFMLFLGLILSAVMTGINMMTFIPGACGPFEGERTVFNVTAVCVSTLAGPAQSTIYYLTSGAFALTLILAEIVILTAYVSRGRANCKEIERLKDILVMYSSDKRYLVKQHATWLRKQSRTSTRDLSTGNVGATFPSQSAEPSNAQLMEEHSFPP